MSCVKKKRVKDKKDRGCIQQTNAQSQSGSAQFSGDGVNGFPPPFSSSSSNLALAAAVAAKRVRVRVRNKKLANGQGQGQIVQSDSLPAEMFDGSPELV